MHCHSDLAGLFLYEMGGEEVEEVLSGSSLGNHIGFQVLWRKRTRLLNPLRSVYVWKSRRLACRHACEMLKVDMEYH